MGLVLHERARRLFHECTGPIASPLWHALSSRPDSARLRLKTVVAALLLGFGWVAVWAQAADISISGDYGEVGSATTETIGSTQGEAVGAFRAPPVADEALSFGFLDCPPAEVKANVVFGEAIVADPVASLSLTARTIESRRKSGDAADDLGSGFLVLGDYRPNLVFSVSYRLAVARLLDNSFHACLQELNVSAKFAPVITIAREVPHGSCLEREILAHERGHWAIDNDTLPGLGPQLEAAASAGIRPRLEGQTMAEMKSRLGADLRNRLDAFLGIFKTARQARQAAHDSPEERERIDQACGKAASEVAARVRSNPPPPPAP